jgi:D-alanyl-D-alanine dipeptidase
VLKHHDFMDRPIPDLSRFRSDKSSYRDYQIHPVSEPCIKVNGDLLCQSYYWHYDPRPLGAMEEIFLRERLISKLIKIDEDLHSLGLRLLIQEGYRPPSVQRFVQEVSVLKGLRKENPELTETELQERVKIFAASVNGDIHSSPPPHSTGGVADLTIVYTESGKPVDMGKKIGGKDSLYKTAFPDALESLGPEFEEARQFRRLLFWLVAKQHMAVNPTEWWHLSLGDQMWAWIFEMPFAIYGAAENFLR